MEIVVEDFLSDSDPGSPSASSDPPTTGPCSGRAIAVSPRTGLRALWVDLQQPGPTGVRSRLLDPAPPLDGFSEHEAVIRLFDTIRRATRTMDFVVDRQQLQGRCILLVLVENPAYMSVLFSPLDAVF